MFVDLENLLSSSEVGKLVLLVGEEIQALSATIASFSVPNEVSSAVMKCKQNIDAYISKLGDIYVKNGAAAVFKPKQAGLGAKRLANCTRLVQTRAFTGVRSESTSRDGREVAKLDHRKAVKLVKSSEDIASRKPSQPSKSSKSVPRGLILLRRKIESLDKPMCNWRDHDGFQYGFQRKEQGRCSLSKFTDKSSPNQELQSVPATPPSNLVVQNYLLPHTLPSIIIRDGKLDENDAQLVTVLTAFYDFIPRIEAVLHAMKDFLKSYNIPTASITAAKLGKKVTNLGMRDVFSKSELVDLLDNKDEVMKFLKTPGWRFKGENGRNIAATVLQANWRRFYIRRHYLEYKRRRKAANIISKIWMQWMQTKAIREKVVFTREQAYLFYQEKSKELEINWRSFRANRRTYIHMPSLGWEEKFRQKVRGIGLRENRQFGRLGDLRDSNVTVIYVSPMPLQDRDTEYSRQFIRLASMGHESTEQAMNKRFSLEVPVHIDRFPASEFCLSTLFKYSGVSLHSVRDAINGQPACLISGFPHLDDLEVAHFLGVPYLGIDPHLASIFGSKCGALRILQEAGIPLPPCESNVCSQTHLIEALSVLIVKNLEIPTWLFKTNQSHDGHGIATFATNDLPCLKWLFLQRSKRYNQWQFTWAHEYVLTRVQGELATVLPKAAIICNTTLYQSWGIYMQDFTEKGGVIQAMPPTTDYTCLTVDVFIDPEGQFSIEGCGDQIVDRRPFSKFGITIPQTSVSPELLSAYIRQIAKTARSVGIIGYLSVDFVTFIDENSQQTVWGVDLGIGYSDSLALFNVVTFSLNAWLNQESLVLETKARIPAGRKKLKQSKDVSVITSKFAVASCALYHSNLEILPPNIFFQICKSISMELSPLTKEGTIFLPVDNLKRTSMGMVVIADSLFTAVSNYSQNLKLMNEEITSSTIQGDNNFSTAHSTLRKILHQVSGNQVRESS